MQAPLTYSANALYAASSGLLAGLSTRAVFHRQGSGVLVDSYAVSRVPGDHVRAGGFAQYRRLSGADCRRGGLGAAAGVAVSGAGVLSDKAASCYAHHLFGLNRH